MAFRLTYRAVSRAIVAALVMTTLLASQFAVAGMTMAMVDCDDGVASIMPSPLDMSGMADDYNFQGQSQDKGCDLDCQSLCLSACGNLVWALPSLGKSGFHKPLPALSSGPGPVERAEAPVEFDTPPPRV